MLPEAKPGLRRKWGQERNQAQHRCPSSSGRKKLVSKQLEHMLPRQIYLFQRNHCEKSQLSELSPPFFQCPLDSRMGAMKAIINTIHMKAVSSTLRDDPSTKKHIHLSQSIESWRQKIAKSRVPQHILRQITGKVRYIIFFPSQLLQGSSGLQIAPGTGLAAKWASSIGWTRQGQKV